MLHVIEICDYSYDLDLDQKLSEETTVLVESYTVSQLCRSSAYG
jgi:hypothetical protein